MTVPQHGTTPSEETIVVATPDDVKHAARGVRTRHTTLIADTLDSADWRDPDVADAEDRVLAWLPEDLAHEKALAPLPDTRRSDRGGMVCACWVVYETDGNGPRNQGAWGVTQTPPPRGDVDLVWLPKAACRTFVRGDVESVQTTQTGLFAFDGGGGDE